MYHKDKVVGLVLGSGMLAQTLVKNCKKKKIRIHIISLENSFELKQYKPDLILEYDKIGNIIIANNTRVNFFNLFNCITEPIIKKEMSIYKVFKVTSLL